MGKDYYSILGEFVIGLMDLVKETPSQGNNRRCKGCR